MKSDLSFYWPFVKLGVTDVWRHKTRSVLTMLGLVFGVGSVIAMLAVGEGASQQALESIKRLGSQNIIVSSVKPVGDSGNSMTTTKQASLSIYGLLFEDDLRIRETVPGVADTSAAYELAEGFTTISNVVSLISTGIIAILLAVSLLFYGWGEPIYILVMLASITEAYAFGFLINKYRESNVKRARLYMVLSLGMNLAALLFFKYCNFITRKFFKLSYHISCSFF